jgi:Tetratricopeptide repeat
MGVLWCFILGGLLLAPTGGFAASPGDPVALLTEIRPGQGDIRVKLATEAEWKAPLPLLSLRAGDQVRVTQNGTAVVMFVGGQGTVRILTANSPYTVPGDVGAQAHGKTSDLVANLTRLLMGKRKDLAYTPLTTRSLKQPPVTLAPRDGKVLGQPILEWSGSDRARYAVRLFGSQGLVWELANLPQAPLPYPPSAPPLSPGVTYRWELETKDFPVQRGQFRVLSSTENAGIRGTLSALEPGALPDYPGNTVTLMRAELLFEQELYAEARKELLAALRTDPDEPTLHLMLGHVYERTGLAALAAEEFDEAQYLSSRTP